MARGEPLTIRVSMSESNMAISRLNVTAGIVTAIAVVTAVVLSELFGTVLFAITVAYLLTPVHRWFVDRGASRWWASALSATVAVLLSVAVLAPIGIVLFQRRDALIATVERVPDSLSFDLLGYQTTITLTQVVDTAVAYLPSVAIDATVYVSSLTIKFGLFGVIVFGLLIGHEAARRAILAPVPPDHRPIIEALEERARETIVAILVLQVGTAAGTFLIGIPVFAVLGYEFPFVLATIAGILQFLPIIGPILLIVLLAAFHLAVGEVVAALLIGIIGGILIGWLPDVIIRPRLARWSAGLPGSLYLIGFIGGLTSLGMVGIIAGPVVVALLVEGINLLAGEMDHTATPGIADDTPG